MRTQRNSGWPAAVILAAILTVPVLSHETPAVQPSPQVVGLAPVWAGGPSVLPAAEPSWSDVPPSRGPTRDPEPVHQLVPERSVEPTSHRTGRSVTGTASYYCNADPRRGRVSRCTIGHPDVGGAQLFAAIRRDLLGHRGDEALVCRLHTSRCVLVTIIDCNCGPDANLVDLYGDAFVKLAPLTDGTVDVTLGWL